MRVALFAMAAMLGACAPPTDAVRVVGSSTVFPFSRTVAEHAARKLSMPAPIIEMTGTGGGFQQFCSRASGVDIANASRPIKPAEVELCAANGVKDIIEFKVGSDGIVVAVAPSHPLQKLTLKQFYLAVAKDIPAADGFMPNPHRRWSAIDPSLPDIPIEVHGPPPTSGTRDAVAELALDEGARAIPSLAALERDDPELFRARARALREDGLWIDEGENDNAIIQLIRASPAAIGVFGFSFYDQSRTLVRGLPIDGEAPSIESIRSGGYPLARSLYFYVNAARADADVARYVREFVGEAAAGELGYLREKGLVPLPHGERARAEAAATMLAARSPAPR